MNVKSFLGIFLIAIFIGAIIGAPAVSAANNKNEGLKVLIMGAYWDGSNLKVDLKNPDSVARQFEVVLSDNADGHDPIQGPITGTLAANGTTTVTFVNAKDYAKFVVVNTLDPGLKDRNDKANMPAHDVKIIYVDKPYPVYIEVIKEVPVEVIKYVDRIVEVPVFIPVEVIKEVTVYVDRFIEIFVPYPVEVIKEVFVYIPVPVEVIKEVPVEVIKIVEVPVEVIKEIPVEVTKTVEVVKEVPTEVVKYLEPNQVPTQPTGGAGVGILVAIVLLAGGAYLLLRRKQ